MAPAVTIVSTSPRTGEQRAAFDGASREDVSHAVLLGAAASDSWAHTPPGRRAAVLRAAADALNSARLDIVRVADFETGLGEPRFQAELDRTILQLRMFASFIETGAHAGVIVSPGDPAASPPRPDMRRLLIPMGTVAVFTPSNFPLAYGVLGGDTASALAAGCAVVVKGHPSHPHTSDLCARAFHEAAAALGAPVGLLSLLQSGAPEISRALVEADDVQAVAFTGSQRVGRLLFDVAVSRPRPIPFYGELGSLNPLFISERAAVARRDAIAGGYIASVTGGSGQFCTKPGVVFVPLGAAGDALVDAMSAELSGRGPSVLLNAGLGESLRARVAATSSVAGVSLISAAAPLPGEGVHAVPQLFVTSDATFFANEALRAEHFGPVAIVVRIEASKMPEAAARFDGQLTATIHAEPEDDAWTRALVRVLMTRAGRLIFNGYPTGLAVVPATTHGGPYPATTAPLHSAVGTTAIRRFLRPVSFQAFPDRLLPAELASPEPRGA
jgi:acyl-CoA reductase-like NAD-dependent aldehyde dehydrogenase